MTPPAGPADGTPRLIALDWGTSALRAYLLGAGGAVLESRAEPWGIMQVEDRDFETAFRGVTEHWLSRAPDLQVLAAGMIGSAQGWLEAPYCPSPAGVEELARSIVHVGAGPLSIVPGVSQSGDAPNVMRGEETQIVGAIAQHPELAHDSLLVLPGTHSKWARVRYGRVHQFTTFLTGELFAVLGASSILGRFARDSGRAPDVALAAEAFERGVQAARASERGIAPLLFSTRARVLAGRLRPEASLEYLSGLLIGDELRCGVGEGERPAGLIGDADLCARYSTALGLFGIHGVRVIEHTAPVGLWAIAEHANLVGPTTARVVA